MPPPPPLRLIVGAVSVAPLFTAIPPLPEVMPMLFPALAADSPAPIVTEPALPAEIARPPLLDVTAAVMLIEPLVVAAGARAGPVPPAPRMMLPSTVIGCATDRFLPACNVSDWPDVVIDTGA